MCAFVVECCVIVHELDLVSSIRLRYLVNGIRLRYFTSLFAMIIRRTSSVSSALRGFPTGVDRLL